MVEMNLLQSHKKTSHKAIDYGLIRLPFITQTIALALVPFEELISFEFGSILRIINIITILLAIITGGLKKSKFRFSHVCLLAFVCLAFISYLWCSYTDLYVDRLLTYGVYFVLIMVLSAISPTEKETNLMLKGLFVGGFIACLLLLMSNGEHSLGDRSTLMIMGKNVNPNRLAFSFVLSGIYSTYHLLYCKKNSRVAVLLWIVVDVLLFIAILMSGSRSSFIAILACILFLFWKMDFGKNVKIKRFIFLILLIALLLIIYNEFILKSDLGDRFSFDNLIGKGKYGFANRDKIWESGIAQYIKKPILGYGNGSSPYVIGELYRFYSTHNSYLMILLEFGIVGFVICSSMFISSYRFYSKINNKLFCSFIIGVLVDIFFIEGFSAKVFWAIMVLIMACQNSESKEI